MSLPPFESIVTEHGPTVLRVCRAIVGPSDADDAWSQTFLSALRAYRDLDPGANVEAWLVRIAHHRAIDLVRSRNRRPTPVADVPDQAVYDASSEYDAALWSAVAALPRKQRLAVAYHHIAGLPYAEVAEIVGGSAAAARKAGSDAIAALRQALSMGASHE